MSTKKEIVSVKGGLCAPRGFRTAALSCGIKDPASPRLDLALVFSDVPSLGAAVFTENEVRAAPVRLSEAYLKGNNPRAVIVNSGNANACTGSRGMENARKMADLAARSLGISRREVLVCSTGIIGVQMPFGRLEPKIPLLAENLGNNSRKSAEAIMTSDTRPKEVAVEVEIGGKTVRIGAIAKGAGMINPCMATMLCFVTTDARISRAELRSATREAADRSFNRITIDGDTSTNDTVIVLANHEAGNRTITKGGPGSRQFREALTEVMLTMAKKIVSDGERVTKFIEIMVKGARSHADAEKVARAVANSSLVKCSWNGNDPNWGRVIHAVGYSGARVREEMVDIYFDGLCAAKSGMTSSTPIAQLQKAVSKKKLCIVIDLNLGRGDYNVFTSDLSPEYVLFNREEYAVTRVK